MVTLEWVDELETQLTDPKQKSIFKVLATSYRHWITESKKQHSWPYDEHVKEMLWDCEVALLAFTRS